MIMTHIIKYATKYTTHFSLFAFIAFFASCQKFLDVKPSTDLVVPQTLEDFIRLMDDYAIMNSTPVIGEISSDNYFFESRAEWSNIPIAFQRNAYIFNPDFEIDLVMPDWNNPYRQVFVANVVLSGLSDIQRTSVNADQWDFVKGWALFMRSYAFFNLAQLFSPAYDAATANTDLGIPLRLLPGVDEHYGRSTLEETYHQIISDMEKASQLLASGLHPTYRNRPSKEAAYAALARIFLAMRHYDLALESANTSLDYYDILIDYNDLEGLSTPFLLSRNHEECIWQGDLGNADGIFSRTSSFNRRFVDTLLYQSYDEGDLRKSFFFRPSTLRPNWANLDRNYSGGNFPFGGFAVDEIYLIKSECLVRSGLVEEGISVLNALLEKRYRTGTYQHIAITEQNMALDIVLSERRKELVFRGLRWQDLKRLNKEGRNLIVKRILDGETYQLLPNSNLYVLPIPPEEIRLNNLEQNARTDENISN